LGVAGKGGRAPAFVGNQHQAGQEEDVAQAPKIRPPVSNLVKGKRKKKRGKKRSSRMKASVLAKQKVGSNECGLWVGLKAREDESFCVGALSIRVSDSPTEWATIRRKRGDWD